MDAQAIVGFAEIHNTRVILTAGARRAKNVR